MSWSHEPPKKEGFYWFRNDGRAPTEIAHFYLGRTPPEGEEPVSDERPHYYTVASDVLCNLEPSNLWWSEELEPPEAPLLKPNDTLLTPEEVEELERLEAEDDYDTETLHTHGLDCCCSRCDRLRELWSYLKR